MRSGTHKAAYVILTVKQKCLNCQAHIEDVIDVGSEEIYTCTCCGKNYRVNHDSKTVVTES